MKVGSILAVRRGGEKKDKFFKRIAKSILPGGIRFFMALYHLKKYGYWRWPQHNHSEMVVDIVGDHVLVCGAVKGGVKIRTLKVAEKDWVDYIVLEPIEELSREQKRDLWRAAGNYREEKTPYQWFNFISWIIYIYTGIWIGKPSDKRVYCFELTARKSNVVYPGNFPRPEITSYWDLWYNAKYGLTWKEYDARANRLKDEVKTDIR